jgi:ankyrin repeat protein
MDAGADINFQDIVGKTPLHITGHAREYEIAYMLLEAGADFRINTKRDKNGLLWAIEKTNRPGSDEIYQWRQKVIEYLRAAGLEINPKYP